MPRCFRKVIRIQATDSPNVKLALAEQACGQEPSGREVTPGVISWEEYNKRLGTWDEIRICIGVRAEFYEGAELLMFPYPWLNHSESLASRLRGVPRRTKGIGIDPGEGVSETTMAAVDERGIVELVARKTPDTTVIVGEAAAFIRKHGVDPERVCIDLGGGGKQLADYLRKLGLNVRTVPFGGAVTPEPSSYSPTLKTKIDQKEDRYVYFDKRSEMYGEFRQLLDPVGERGGFAIPAEYVELRRQLSPIPLTYDGEGRLRLLPKNKRSAGSNQKTLTELLGCSPDQADAVVLACHGLLHEPPKKVRVGAM